MALTNVSERIRESCRGLALCRVPGDCVGLALAPCRVPGDCVGLALAPCHVPGGPQVAAPQRRRNRQGVALIMVVGLLALMMVMAVAFAIFMRTERVAAGSFRTDVRARNLLQVALSRAVYAIDTNMSAAGLSYPGWEALYSGGGSVYVREALTKDALEQIPLGALTPSGTCLGGGNDNVVVDRSVPGGGKGAIINLTDHSFGLITNVVDLGGGNSRVFHTKLTGGRNNTWAAGVDTYYFLQPALVDLPATSGGGRYGYVVINCSGLPDANYVGGVARSIGTNVTEIQISAIPGGVNPATLVTERSTPFETHQELVGRGMASGAFTDYPDYYVCYSSAVTNDGRVYIGGSAAELVGKRAEIIHALTNLTYQDTTTPSMKFSLAEAGIIFTNLIDYVDADRIPGNLNGTCPASPGGPYVEAVPMANEIVVSNVYVCTYNAASSNYTVSGTINCYAEYTLPFKGLAAPDKRFQYSIAVTGVTADAILNYPGILQNTPSMVVWPGIGDYIVRSHSGPIAGGVAPNLSFTNSMTCGVVLRVNDTSGNAVDTNAVVAVTLAPSVQWNGLNATVVMFGNMECVDPRLNHDASMWMRPSALDPSVTAPHTLNTTNFVALFYMNKAGNPSLGERRAAEGRDGDTAMYVPFSTLTAGSEYPLRSAGELGYLFFGRKWETIRLARLGTRPNNGQIHAVLDHFTTDATASGIPKGRINPNTRDTAVLNAVLEGLPLNKRHSGSATAGTPLSVGQRDAVRAALLNRSATNAFDSAAELGAVRWELIDSSWSSLDKESVVRNSSGLFDPRQNFFTILLYADVTKMDIAGNSTAMSSIMGVAEVWRDPGTNTFPVNVRSLQIMEAQ